MQHNYIVLSSLSMDLKRVALGLHRKSFVMADTFIREAQLRKQETDSTALAPYMQVILQKLDDVFTSVNDDTKAECALMYSTLIQNYVIKNFTKP